MFRNSPGTGESEEMSGFITGAFSMPVFRVLRIEAAFTGKIETKWQGGIKQQFLESDEDSTGSGRFTRQPNELPMFFGTDDSVDCRWANKLSAIQRQPRAGATVVRIASITCAL
jgi:hypothetical protein